MRYPELHNKNWLEERYLKDKLSCGAIAKIIGCSRNSVVNYVKKHNIPIRNAKENRALQENVSKKYPQLNDKNWLINRYVVQEKSTIEIANEIGAISGNSIRQSLRRHDIHIRDREEALRIIKENDGFIMNLPVIEGCLLGDASLRKTKIDNPNHWPHFHKKNKYYDHVRFVADLLFKESPGKRIKDCSPLHFFLRSLANEQLKPLHERWYSSWNNYIKVIPEDLDVSAELLLHWFMDDGTAYHRRKKSKTKQICITFCTDCFDRDQQELLCDKLNAKFNLEAKTTPYRKDKGHFRIKIPQSQTPLFYEIIGPPPVESLAYKWK